MTNEIKEILDRLDYNEWEVDLYKVPITWSELYDIRDYITNLQQRIDNAIKYINSFCLEKDGYVHYGDDLDPEELVDILRGDE